MLISKWSNMNAAFEAAFSTKKPWLGNDFKGGFGPVVRAAPVFLTELFGMVDQ